MAILPPVKVTFAKRIPIDLTPAQTQAFWRYFQKIYGTRVVQKATAREMKAIAWFLDLIGVMDHKSFLSNYTTTIGKTIYTPYKIGKPNDGWTNWGQCVTCIHEHVHVDQYNRHGRFKFFTRYLLSSAKRAMYEAEAYRSNMELHFWRHGRLPDIKKLAGKLESYGCAKIDIKVAEKLLASSAMAVKRGAVINRASKFGIRWLERNAPALKART